MAHPFRFLREKMAPEAQQVAEQKTQAMLKELPFQELRQVRRLPSQEQLSTRLQTTILKIRRRIDDPINTSRRFVKPGGDRLNIDPRLFAEISHSKSLKNRHNLSGVNIYSTKSSSLNVWIDWVVTRANKRSADTI